MASFNVIVSFAVLVAYAVAAQVAEESFVPQPNAVPQTPEVQQPVAPENAKDEHARSKKFAVYSSYAYTYPGYVAPVIPAVSSYAYTYQRAVPYAYSAAYYPAAYPLYL